MGITRALHARNQSSILCRSTIYNFYMTPFKNNLFLKPIKKAISSSSGIILEEDKWELDPNKYTVFLAWPEADQSLVGLEVICSDGAGINCVVWGRFIKVVTPELVLGTL